VNSWSEVLVWQGKYNFQKSIFGEMITTQPSLGFVLVFLLFSLLFLSNSYKLWFKTDQYYQDIYNSLTSQPSLYPFREFFLKRMKNKKSWLFWQKAFSLLGVLAVLLADVLMVLAYLQ
jgi:hypothetical protein